MSTGTVTRRPPFARWPLVSVATLLTYNTWAVYRQVNGHQQIINGYLSELSASDQPHNLFFRGGDLLTALIMGAVGLRALRVWPRLSSRRRWWYVAAGGLLLFSLSTLLDSFFSMDCSPTLSASCKVLEETGRLSAIHYAHTYTSVGAETGIVASMVAAYLALRRSASVGGRWRRWLLAVCVVEVGSLVVLLVMLAVGSFGIGYPQAVTVVAGSVWFAAAGIALARTTVGEHRPTRPREQTLVH